MSSETEIKELTIQWNCGACDVTHELTETNNVAGREKICDFAQLLIMQDNEFIVYTFIDGNRVDITNDVVESIAVAVIVTMLGL